MCRCLPHTNPILGQYKNPKRHLVALHYCDCYRSLRTRAMNTNCISLLCVLLALATGSCSELTYTPNDFDATVDTLVDILIETRENILQNTVDRSNGLLLRLIGYCKRFVHTNIEITPASVIDNRISEFVHDYTNDVWLNIDSTEKALDILYQNTERKIESIIGEQGIEAVADAFHELCTLLWTWQDGLDRYIYSVNARGQALMKGVGTEAFEAFQNEGPEGYERVLDDREQLLRDLSQEVLDFIARGAREGEPRFQELVQQIRDADQPDYFEE